MPNNDRPGNINQGCSEKQNTSENEKYCPPLKKKKKKYNANDTIINSAFDLRPKT